MRRISEWFLWKMLIMAVALVPYAYSMDYPVEFVQNSGGDLAVSGLPGFRSTPARYGDPGFGLSYARLKDASMQVAGIAGEMCVGCGSADSVRVGQTAGRIAFLSSYTEMDSIYRRVYTEVDVSLSRAWLVLGGGYAFSAEWIPGSEHWGRHRFKSGGTLLWKCLSLSAMLSGWTDIPWSEMEYAVGAAFNANDRFSGFIEWNGESVDVGSSVRFEYVEIRSSYRFPDFGLALSLSFCLGGASAEGVYGSRSSNWNWFGFSLSKKLRKKAIL